MTCRHVYYLCLAAFGALTTVSVYAYLYCQDSEPGLVLDEPEKILPELIVDREYVLDFRVHNRSNQTLRVVGMEFT